MRFGYRSACEMANDKLKRDIAELERQIKEAHDIGFNKGVDAVVEALRRRERCFKSKFLADGIVDDILKMKVES